MIDSDNNVVSAEVETVDDIRKLSMGAKAYGEKISIACIRECKFVNKYGKYQYGAVLSAKEIFLKCRESDVLLEDLMLSDSESESDEVKPCGSSSITASSSVQEKAQ
jgi:hypothetical protein